MCISWPRSPISVNAHSSALAFYKAKIHDKVHPFGNRFFYLRHHTYVVSAAQNVDQVACHFRLYACRALLLGHMWSGWLRGMERHFLLSIEASRLHVCWAATPTKRRCTKAPCCALLCFRPILCGLSVADFFCHCGWLGFNFPCLSFCCSLPTTFTVKRKKLQRQWRCVFAARATVSRCGVKMAASERFGGKESFALLSLSLDCRLLSLFKLRTSTTTVIVIMFANAARTMVVAIAAKKCI